jgi:hypothetical protein
MADTMLIAHDQAIERINIAGAPPQSTISFSVVPD